MHEIIHSLSVITQFMVFAAGNQKNIVISYLKPGLIEFYLVAPNEIGVPMINPDFTYHINPDDRQLIKAKLTSWIESAKIERKIDAEHYTIIPAEDLQPITEKALQAWGMVIGALALISDVSKSKTTGDEINALVLLALDSTIQAVNTNKPEKPVEKKVYLKA